MAESAVVLFRFSRGRVALLGDCGRRGRAGLPFMFAACADIAGPVAGRVDFTTFVDTQMPAYHDHPF